MEKALRIITVFSSLLMFGSVLRAQCDNSFIQTDAFACLNDSVTVTLDTNFYGSFIIDFCETPLEVIDTLVDLGNLGGTLTNPQSISLIKDDVGNWYGFVKNTNMNNLLKLDYGASLDNVPTVSSVTLNASSSVSGTSRSGIEFVKLQDVWYGLAVTTNARFIIVELGNNFSTNTFDATVYDNPGGALSSAAALDYAFEDDSLIVVILNDNGGLVKVNFAQSFGAIQNVTTDNTLPNNSAISSGRSIEVAQGCGDFHVFVGDGSGSSSDIFHLDFGSSLNNTPSMGLLGTVAGRTSEMLSTRIAGEYQLWVKQFNNTEGMTVFEFDASITNLIDTTVFQNSSGVLKGLGFDLVYDQGKYEAQIMLANPQVLTRVHFDEPCNAFPEFVMNDTASALLGDTGTNNISVLLIDSNDAYTHFTKGIEAFFSPMVDFELDGNCVGVPTAFTDSSTSPYGFATWEWDFGNSDTALQQHPAYVYADTGAFTISLLATDSAGCTGVALDTIQVFASPAANFGTSLSCQGKNTIFTDSSLVSAGFIAQSLWLFPALGDTLSGTSLSIAFDSSGTVAFDHVAISDQGCLDTVSGSITVLPSPVVDIGMGSTCFGDTLHFINNTQSSIPYTHLWHFGDASPNSTNADESHYYADTGTYGFYYIATGENQCADTQGVDLRISNIPGMSIQLPPTNVCAVEFNDFFDVTDYGNETVNGRLWLAGTDSSMGNPGEFQFSNASSAQSIELHTSIGTNCVVDTAFSIRVLEGVTALFAPYDLCHGDTVTFRDTSMLPANQQIASTTWKFGDGSTASGYPINHSYADTGYFNVTYILESDSGCENTIAYDIRIVERTSVMLFLDELLCSDLDLDYDIAIEIDPFDQLDSVWWGFEAGGIDTTLEDNEGSVIVPFAGDPLIIRHFVETRQGCNVETVDTVTVRQSPVVDFTFDTVCAGNYTQLTDNYSGENFEWNWFVNNTYNLFNDDPSVLLPGRGAFPVSLTLTAASGCWDTLTNEVIVSGIDSLGVSSFGFCEGSQGQLTVGSSLYHDRPAMIEWSINGQDGYFGETAQFALNTGTNYGYLVTYRTEHGCVSFFEGVEMAREAPSAGIIAEPDPGNNLAFAFDVTGDTTVQRVNWDFGDGAILDSTQALHTYATLGQYAVAAHTTFVDGCQATALKRVNVGDVNLGLQLTDFQTKLLTNITGFSATMTNTGLINVESARLSLSSEKGERIAEQWTGVLSPRQSIAFDLATQVFDPASFYCLELIVANDSIEVSDEVLCITTGPALNASPAFPNPAEDQVSVYIYSHLDAPVQLALYNSLGDELGFLNYSIFSSDFGQRLDMNLSALNSGTYFLRIAVENEIFVRSIVKR